MTLTVAGHARFAGTHSIATGQPKGLLAASMGRDEAFLLPVYPGKRTGEPPSTVWAPLPADDARKSFDAALSTSPARVELLRTARRRSTTRPVSHRSPRSSNTQVRSPASSRRSSSGIARPRKTTTGATSSVRGDVIGAS